MLRTLRISQFRALRSLKVEGLTPVTLFVGTNNAGKSSILEAAETLLGIRNRIFANSSIRRGEFLSTAKESPRTRRVVDPSQLFHGRRLAPGISFHIDGENDEQLSVSCDVMRGPTPSPEPDEIEQPLTDDLSEMGSLALHLTSDQGESRIPLTAEGGLDLYQLRQALAESEPEKQREFLPVKFLGPNGRVEIGPLWDKVVLTPDEERVVEALRIIEPTIERLAALGSTRADESSVAVKLVGSDQRLPLGSMGDGIRHLLVLSLSLISSARGCLLIDEIDTGLHYSVMKKMWKLVVETSRRLDVQVLASTHSGDCVEALACLFSENPDVRDTISLHRVEKDQEQTICYSAEELLAASKHRMEVR